MRTFNAQGYATIKFNKEVEAESEEDVREMLFDMLPANNLGWVDDIECEITEVDYD